MTIPYRGNPPPIDDELLSAYLDGEVSPDERAAVEAAIAADADLRARATDLRATVSLLRMLPQPVPRRTFILTPEQAAAIRPARTSWVIRFFPTIAAVGAVAAVLCLVLLGGDLATGGFATTQREPVSALPAIESVSAVAVAQATTAALAPAAAAATPVPFPVAPTSLPAPAAANAPAPAPASAAARAANGSAPAAAGALVSSTGTAAFGSAGAPVGSAASQAIATTAPAPVRPTVVANAQPPPARASVPSPGGAVVTRETHRVPVALVRAGEILLALLAVAGLTLAVLGRRRASLRAR